MPPTDRLVLLDTASLYFRAFYGVPDRRRTPDALPTNAVRGLVDMIATLVTRLQPTEIVACWDNDWRPAFRTAAIPTYKTHRLKDGSDDVEQTPEALLLQVPVICEVLAAVGILRIGADGYEADDVIGTLAHRHRQRLPVDVVTGDRDLFQLVDDARSVRVVYTARGGVRDADVVTEEFLKHKYDVSSGRAYADMAVLRGDTSDGLPGVTGIGEKTAAAMINRYGDLAGLRRAVVERDAMISPGRLVKLEAASDYLDAAPGVVDVALDCPIRESDLAIPTEVADPQTLLQLVEQHDLRNPVNRLLRALDIHV